MKKLALVLLFAACGKSDNKPAPKVEDTKPAPAAPAKVEPPKPEPAKPEAKKGGASDADQALVLGVGEAKEAEFKSPSGDAVKVAVKARVDKKHHVTDVLVNGKVLTTYDSKIEEGDTHYETHAAVKVVPEGVLVVFKTIKATGKPADSYRGQLLTWNASAKKLELGRTIDAEQTYDPSKDG